MKRNEILGIASISLTLIGVVFAYLDYSKERELSCQVDVACFSSLVPIASLNENVQPSYKGQIASDLCFSTLHFNSSGELPIEPADFQDQPIEVHLGPNTVLVDAELRDRNPTEISMRFTHDSSSVRISPTLLNQGDEFTVFLVSQGAAPEVHITSRIAGISYVETVTRKRLAPNISVLVALLCIASGLSTFLGYGLLGKMDYSQNRLTEVVILPKRRIGRWLIPVCTFVPALCAFIALPFAGFDYTIPLLLSISFPLSAGVLFMFKSSYFSVYERVEGKRRNDLAFTRLNWDEAEERKGYIPPSPPLRP